MKPRYDQIPEELRALRNWVVWRLEKRPNKAGVVRETKPPYNARSGKLAKSNDPSTWSSYEEATAALQNGYNGVGFCLTPPYVGVDLDGCRQNGIHEPWAEEIIGELDSYSELSPSRDGVHVIVKGELPNGQRQKDLKDREHHGVGLYDAARGRYLTMTGDVIHNGGIAQRTPELRCIYARLFPPPKPKSKATAKSAADGSISDNDLLEKARSAKDAGKFSRLFDGRWEGEYPSPSEADQALCMKLAFWTDRDPVRMDRLFRRSKLMREKWNRDDYRERTIEAALKRQTETVAAWPREGSIVLAASAVDPSIEMLNSMAVFHGRLRFQSISRRGSMILGITENNQEIIFATMTDLTSFARARAAIAEGTDVLLPQPPRNKVSATWDPVAATILKLAARDAIRVPHVLKAEVKDLLILMFRYAKQPSAAGSKEFMEFLVKISAAVRDPKAPAPPCVFTAEECCWVHLPTFRNWISLSTLTNRLYPFGDIRQGLLLLGFEYKKDVTRGHDGDSESASLWRGPVDVLFD